MKIIDLNCDMGESYGAWQMGADAEVMPHISSSAAELNGYPGPSHTLELAAPLGLSAAQKEQSEALYARMQAEAIRAGEEVIARETALDALFRDGRASAAGVEPATAAAACAQGGLRAVHLRYHLLMRELLTPEQTAKYAALRGYR